METELNRIAELLEQLADQSAPWERTRTSAPPGSFTDRHGRRIQFLSTEDGPCVTALAANVERTIFDGTWPQCRRFMDRLFREDITARALAASAEAPTEPAITWRPGGGYITGFVHDAEFGEVRQYVRYSGSGSVWVLEGEHGHRIADCANEDAAKALCEAWERALAAANKEVQS